MALNSVLDVCVAEKVLRILEVLQFAIKHVFMRLGWYPYCRHNDTTRFYQARMCGNFPPAVASSTYQHCETSSILIYVQYTVYYMCTRVYCVLYAYLSVLCIVCVLVCIVYCMCTRV